MHAQSIAHATSLQGDRCMELDHGVVYSTAAAMQRISTNILVMFAMTYTVSYKDMLTAQVELLAHCHCRLPNQCTVVKKASCYKAVADRLQP